MRRILAILLIFPVFSGCGYTAGTVLPANLKTVYVETFKNKIDVTKELDVSSAYESYIPRLEIDITNALTKRLIYDGSLKLADRDDADCMLSGELVNFLRQPLRYNDWDEAEEYRINITVNIYFTDLRKNKLIWQEEYLIGDATYFVSGEFSITEEKAIEKAVENLARRIMERVVENW